MMKYQIVAAVLFVGVPVLMFVIWRLRRTPGFFNEVFPVAVRGTCRQGELICDANFDTKRTWVSEFHIGIPHDRFAEMRIYGILGPRTIHRVLYEIDERGYLPANMEEVLSFCRKYRGEVRRYPIWALGAKAKIEGRLAVLGVYIEKGNYTLGFKTTTAEEEKSGLVGIVFNTGDAFLVIPKTDRPIR